MLMKLLGNRCHFGQPTASIYPKCGPKSFRASCDEFMKMPEYFPSKQNEFGEPFHTLQSFFNVLI